jgi:hypothetical protein
MLAASVAASALLSIVLGPENRGAVLAGSAGPLVAAVGTWVVVHRIHRRAPARVSAAMIKLLAAKMLFFGLVVVAAVALLRGSIRAFVVSLTSQYIMLHFLEAVFLRRLFAAGPGRPGAD